ncbi:ABC transporter B family protein [Heterostelium album PN500]|uniref:ABC transporter B family protein n=1 Tax=Heterostelium pallidum (strain ATCC 26659 / Pp 5 / PN500) TaxID=670386 RepID=D3AW75_HETP5|nr:ABC transporter B family protein [Heterostelium album PN500]EFA86548.1 ABC transporter B family protein [Heterostelium album PN500]|eukprot:XP_020438653.1 ABC transporter B family protein [Heterostelium album PN500]
MSNRSERKRLLDDNNEDAAGGDRDVESQVLLHPVNSKEPLRRVAGGSNDDNGGIYEDGLSVVEKQRQKSTLYMLRLASVVLLVGYVLSTNLLFFIGNRVVFYPNPISPTPTTSPTPTASPNNTSVLDQFNIKYFFYFSTFDVLLLSYVLAIFWTVCLFLTGYLYQLSTIAMSVLGLIYIIIKSAFAIPMLTKTPGSIDPSILPVNSPILTRDDAREMTLACIANSIGLIVLYLALNAYPLLVARVEHKIEMAKEKKKLEDAEAMDSSINKAAKRPTRINNSNAKRLAKLSKPELPLILCGMIALIFSSFSSLAIPAFFGQIVQVLSASRDINTLNNSTLALVIIFLIGSLSTSIRAYLFTLAGQRFVARMRKELFAAIIKQDVAFFDQSRTGELVNRLASDTQVLQNTVTVNISMAVRYTIQIIGAIILLFITNWRLTLVMLAIIPILAVSAVFYGKKVKMLGKQVQEELAKSSTTGEEVISNIRTVKAFAKEEKFVAIYGKDVHQSYLIGKKLALAGGIFSGGVFLVAQLAIVLIVYVGAKQVLNGDTTTGNLTSFLLYTLSVAMALAFVSSLFGDFMQAVGASDRIFELMDKVPSIPITGGDILPNPVGEIELKDVNFTYPTRGTQVLTTINLKIQTGTVTALVGPSGGGKSTIVSLIERFYDPNSGVITLDGVDIKRLDPRWYRSIIGFVSQEPLLFAGTIKENISFGVENASMDDIRAAAEKANAHQFIGAFESTYDTVVGERGVRLSGGQKQRIAIARALLLNPKVLLLDEATSALDAESEYLVKEAIDRLMHNRTVLVIAHRLSTVVNANSVMVVNQEEIWESLNTCRVLVFACHLEDVQLPVEVSPVNLCMIRFMIEEVVIDPCFLSEFSYWHVPEANASFFPAERSSFDSHPAFVFALPNLPNRLVPMALLDCSTQLFGSPISVPAYIQGQSAYATAVTHYTKLIDANYHKLNFTIANSISQGITVDCSAMTRKFKSDWNLNPSNYVPPLYTVVHQHLTTVRSILS